MARLGRLEEANRVCESDAQLAEFLRPFREGPLTPKVAQSAHVDIGDRATWIR